MKEKIKGFFNKIKEGFKKVVEVIKKIFEHKEIVKGIAEIGAAIGIDACVIGIMSFVLKQVGLKGALGFGGPVATIAYVFGEICLCYLLAGMIGDYVGKDTDDIFDVINNFRMALAGGEA